MNLKQTISSIPFLGSIAQRFYHPLINLIKPFKGSDNYWNERYNRGRNSGDGSYNQLAEFKAEILNRLVIENSIETVIEYGCGDGNQLSLAKYPNYIGFDISPKAINICFERFSEDKTKQFKLMKDYTDSSADLTLSLDVIYHLVEDEIFSLYMHRLFDSSVKLVVIYSSNTNENPRGTAAHVRHRHFSQWVLEQKTDWRLLSHIPNKFPFRNNTKNGSFADFYIYSKV